MIATIENTHPSEAGIADDGGNSSTGDDIIEQPVSVTIELNSHAVIVHKKCASGLEIKEAAILQGVEIQPYFVLHLELPNGTARSIGDNDVIRLHDHQSFTAIAPDDNS